jgi:two-component system cell cycle response regulator
VVLPETPLAVAVVVAERLRATIAEQPIMVGDPAIGLNISISVGVSVTRGADETAASLMRRADEALYAAKAHGRNCVMTFPADAVTADGAAA